MKRRKEKKWKENIGLFLNPLILAPKNKKQRKKRAIWLVLDASSIETAPAGRWSHRQSSSSH